MINKWPKLSQTPAFLAVQDRAARLKKLHDADRCECGAMPELLPTGESICRGCADGEVEEVTCDDCGTELPSQEWKDDHSGFCSDCLLTFNL